MAKTKPDAGTHATAETTRTLTEAGLQALEAVTIHRRDLHAAPCNPRTMTEAQRRKLKAGTARNSPVAPPTWSFRTGNIVCGHQRLSILDSLMGTSDYTLKVAKIDVPPNREMELNVLLNNSAAMGDRDVGAPTELFKDDSMQVEGTAFDLGDVYQLMGEASFQECQDDSQAMAEKLDAA